MSIERLPPSLLCLGPLNQNANEVCRRIDRAKHMDAALVSMAVVDASVALGGELNTGKLIGYLAGVVPEAARVLKTFANDGCGFDLREVIAEIPEDGEEHEYDCPSCGMPHTVRRTPPTE